MKIKKIVSQSLLLLRDLSYQRHTVRFSDEQAQLRLKITGELADIVHNIPDILCEHPNDFLTHLFICKLKNFLREYPQYSKYFENCSLPDKTIPELDRLYNLSAPYPD